MWRIYRFIFWIFVSLSVLSTFHVSSAQAEEETFFIVTAYYSPLPGQIKYYHGSYEREIYINWKWTHGASGREVFEWMLAAPKNYPFGTKIYLEWYGIAEVQDRWWAIVNAWNRGHQHDRIDIWMGFWDDGRNRAIQWWSRTIQWKIVSSDSENTIRFWTSKIGDLGNIKLTPESDSQRVSSVQTVFKRANLYNGEIDGNYESIKPAIIDFQLSRWVISSNDAYDAWYIGSKTLAALRKEFSITSPLQEEWTEVFLTYKWQEHSPEYKLISQYQKLRIDPDSSSDDIRKLQELLQWLKKYDGEIDGNYKSIEWPLIDLQIHIWVVENRDDWGAGHFGNKTMSALLLYYDFQSDNDTSWEQLWEETVTPEKQETVQEMPAEEAKKFEATLSASQKKELDVIIQKLDRLITKRAKAKNIDIENFKQTIIQKIEIAVSEIQDSEIKLKLIYIVENL